jgi:hypothetical protein
VFERVRGLDWSGNMLLVAGVALDDADPNRSRIAERCLVAKVGTSLGEKRVLCVVSCVLSPLRGLVDVISSVKCIAEIGGQLSCQVNEGLATSGYAV